MYIVKRVGDRARILHFGDGCALVIELVLVIKSGTSRGALASAGGFTLWWLF